MGLRAARSVARSRLRQTKGQGPAAGIGSAGVGALVQRHPAWELEPRTSKDPHLVSQTRVGTSFATVSIPALSGAYLLEGATAEQGDPDTLLR
jgi:hypothetical protein